MTSVPPIIRRRVSDDELRARVEEWKAAHPGFDESNYPNAFRDESGELIEDDEFFKAVELFSLYALLTE